MQYRKTWLILLMVALMALWGCSDDDDDGPTTPTGTAFEVMAAAGAAYINDSAQCPGVLSAEALHDNLDDYTVIDIRQEGAYLAGHIPGAYHSSLGTLLDDLANTIPSDKPYVIACYSGQSAGHAKIAMELMGYDDVFSLLYGMSSWNNTLDVWTAKCADTLPAGMIEQDNQNDNLTEHDFPVLSEDAGSVVADRVALMLTNGFKGLPFTGNNGNNLIDHLDEYFVINYFGVADYEGDGESGVPGHIQGAFQFTPYQSLGIDQMLDNLPTDMPIVVYCWTGQHSSQVTAYLNMLGYEAYSLSNGSNNLFYTSLTAHKWNVDTASHDYELETGPMAEEPFATIAAAMADYINDSAQCPGTISAVDLHDNLDDYTVIDIRQETAYNAGHIPGAYHSGLSTILDDLDGTIPNDKPYVIACYSGQSAGHVKIAMELMGYDDVYTLLFGMSSWNTSLDVWTAKCADNLPAGMIEQENQNENLVAYNYPTLDAGATVASRVEAMLAAGFKGLPFTGNDGNNLIDHLDEYFVINYFGVADYEGDGESGVPGHIQGAFQFTPYQSMGVGQMLSYIPTDMPVVVYCWTGQHSSQITAYLNMLGYEAYSLSNGSNNLFYSELTAHKWHVDTQSHDYDLTDPITF